MTTAYQLYVPRSEYFAWILMTRVFTLHHPVCSLFREAAEKYLSFSGPTTKASTTPIPPTRALWVLDFETNSSQNLRLKAPFFFLQILQQTY